MCWMTADVCVLMRSRDSAFRAGVKAALRTARVKLSWAISEAKCTHAQRIHGYTETCGASGRVLNYRTTCDSDPSFPDALNNFYSRFEAQNDVTTKKTTPPPNDKTLCLTIANVRKTLLRVKPTEACWTRQHSWQDAQGMC